MQSSCRKRLIEASPDVRKPATILSHLSDDLILQLRTRQPSRHATRHATQNAKETTSAKLTPADRGRKLEMLLLLMALPTATLAVVLSQQATRAENRARTNTGQRAALQERLPQRDHGTMERDGHASWTVPRQHLAHRRCGGVVARGRTSNPHPNHRPN